MSQLKQIKLQINGVEKNVLAQVIDKKFWFRIDQQTECIDIADLSVGSTSKTKSQGKSAHLIAAPMPGKVTKIFIQPGDEVQKSQALLVMEAMKMEYTLKADFATTVEKLNVKLGDQVTLGFLLVELKPTAGVTT